VSQTILQRWSITPEELTAVVDGSPSLRGMILGYVAEMKLRNLLLSDGRINEVRKPDDHDRRKKGDLVVTYRNQEIKVESKSLQTNSIRRLENGRFTGKVQCDASDSRFVTLPSGRRLQTTCLLVGEFDVLAASLFAFEDKWHFTFALNRDLPRSSFRGYTKYQRSHLLASLVPVTWPPEPPFVSDPFVLLDRLLQSRPH
jgi:hypothetical protein